MTEVKPWWMSRAILGALSGIIVGIFGLAGYSLDTEQLTGLLLAIATLISSGVSLYGSIHRKTPIDPTLVAPGIRLQRDQLPPDDDGAAGDRARESHLPTGPFFDDSRR